MGSIPTNTHIRLGTGLMPSKKTRKHCLELLDFQIPTDPWVHTPGSLQYMRYQASPHVMPGTQFFTLLELQHGSWWGEKRLLSSLAAAAGWVQGGWTGACTATGVSVLPDMRGACVYGCVAAQSVSIPSPPQAAQQRTSLTSDTQQLRGWGKRDNLERL